MGRSGGLNRLYYQRYLTWTRSLKSGFLRTGIFSSYHTEIVFEKPSGNRFSTRADLCLTVQGLAS